VDRREDVAAVRAVVAGIGNHPRRSMRSIGASSSSSSKAEPTSRREVALAPLETDSGKLEDVTITFDELRPTNRLTGAESIGLGEVGIRDP